MYHIYTDGAFVLRGADIGESGRLFYLLTRSMGTVRAKASGVRLLKSKLRPHFKKYSFINVSMVRGRENWKIVGAEDMRDIFTALRGKKRARRLISRLSELILRLSPEEENDGLFRVMEDMANFMENFDTEDKNFSLVEAAAVARLLRCLGYMDGSGLFYEDIFLSPWNDTVINGAKAGYRELVFSINRAFKESML